jgi:hypothetical protein
MVLTKAHPDRSVRIDGILLYGLTLLIFAASRYPYTRPCVTNVCGLKLLMYAFRVQG